MYVYGCAAIDSCCLAVCIIQAMFFILCLQDLNETALIIQYHNECMAYCTYVVSSYVRLCGNKHISEVHNMRTHTARIEVPCV